MTSIRDFQAQARARREEAAAAEVDLARAASNLVVIDEQIRAAELTGDREAISAAMRRRKAAATREKRANERLADVRSRLDGLIGSVIGELEHANVIAGLDRRLPLLMLPVRLETRFDDDPDLGRVLRVRIYPDDIHVDDHEPRLTSSEVDWGKAYWTKIRTGGPEAEAWSGLAGRVGPFRALHVRESLAPENDEGEPAFPDLSVRPDGASRTPVARALPDQFIVRVRIGGSVKFVPGNPVADTLAVGADLSGTSTSGEDALLGQNVKWMSDYGAAVDSGMAVTVPIPAGTTTVDDVTVVGVCLSTGPADSADLINDLVSVHRVTRGAGFVPAGTPSNNLADTTSGYTSRPDPSRIDPASRPAPSGDDNAAIMAKALGIGNTGLSRLTYAEEREDAEARAMQRALFEACWGPYLRTQAQPGFDLRLMPKVHDFVTEYLRPGGPLPAMRMGRQPYAFLPIAPSGWKSSGDNRFVSWLTDSLPSLRRFWLAGVGDVPDGLSTYSHEAVSTRVRIRTANASMVQPIFYDMGLGNAAPDMLSPRRLLAEVGIEDVLPAVVTTLFAKGQVDLWLPMSIDGDTAFFMRDPKPKDAGSILGLLLRNAALQVISAAADEYRGGMASGLDPSTRPYVISNMPSVSLGVSTVVAIPTVSEFVSTAAPSLSQKLETEVSTAAGESFRVGDRIDDLLAGGIVPDFERYSNTDAVVAFRAAIDDIAAIPTERRARLTGEVLDASSHRYDAWVTALATRRLRQMRSAAPEGIQIGAWGYVEKVKSRTLAPVTRDDLPENTELDGDNGGFILSPSMQHANVAGVLRAAFLAHGGAGGGSTAPFAVSLRSRRVRAALELAQGMRNGQPLGALLGYHLERQLHERSGGDAEVDWAIYELRERYPLKVDSGDNATASAQRIVVNGWAVAQQVMKTVNGPSEMATDLGELPASTGHAAIEASLRSLIEMIDGLADLGLSEAMFQLAGRNLDRASASTDMIGRAGLPPDRFDVAATPRGGTTIEQRLVIGFKSMVRPDGWSKNGPRADLAPEADAFVARQLGSAKTVTVRLVDDIGVEQGRCQLDQCGLSALDVAADAAAHGTMDRLPLLLARACMACAVTGAVRIALEPGIDDDLLDLLACGAAWHRALAGKMPLGARSLRLRSDDVTEDASKVDTAIASLRSTFVLETLDAELWSMHVPKEAVKTQYDARVSAFEAAKDAVAKARALFGGDAVLTGSTGAPGADISATLGDQKALGTDDRGVVAGWLQDSGRVRTSAGAVDEAMLLSELAGSEAVPLRAAQSPAAPYVDGETPLPGKRWIGSALPTEGALGPYQLLSIVCIGEGDSTGIVGIELDAWTEVVPAETGSGAIAANLPAPDSRPPNLCLVAVPADPNANWSRDSLFSVVDEALELAQCRAVDLDATRRVPAFLPTTYIADYQEPLDWRDLVSRVSEFPTRYVAKGAS